MNDIEMLLGSPPVAVETRRSTSLKRGVLLIGVPMLVVIASVFVYLTGGRYADTEDAYLKADKVPISAEVAGTIKQVLVRENQTVAKGQPLLRLDDTPFRLTVARAQANLAQVRDDLAALKASYHAKEAQIDLARTNQAYRIKEQQRQINLAAKGFISAASLDDARHSTDVSSQQIISLQYQLRNIAEALGGNASLPVEQHPRYLAAHAELQQARLDLSRTQVRASIAGTVSNVPKPGQYLPVGSPALALVGDQLWIEANFTETQLTYVRPGEHVKVRVDTYPDTEWQGVVRSLSPATGAEFAVIPAQNATGNWVKIAQRVPVRIRLLQNHHGPPLRAGLSTWIQIDTGHRRELFGWSL